MSDERAPTHRHEPVAPPRAAIVPRSQRELVALSLLARAPRRDAGRRLEASARVGIFR